MEVAIFGANSQIAKDLIRAMKGDDFYRLTLYVRDIDRLDQDSLSLLSDERFYLGEYESFSSDYKFDAILNFVGVGDPSRAKAMAGQILDITQKYDDLALSYLDDHPRCRYIFLSSGAVYGGGFDKAFSEDSRSSIPVNEMRVSDFYGIAKLHAEAKHRARTDREIVDLRVFNYFSSYQDISSSFLISDITRAIIDGSELPTSSTDLVRDYITPIDFYRIIDCLLRFRGKMRGPVDCYSKSPVGKFELLDVLVEKFGLNYSVDSGFSSLNATGVKNIYCSDVRSAEHFGYRPSLSSIDGLIIELEKYWIIVQALKWRQTKKAAMCGFFIAWRKVCQSLSSSCCRFSRTPAAKPAFLFPP